MFAIIIPLFLGYVFRSENEEDTNQSNQQEEGREDYRADGGAGVRRPADGKQAERGVYLGMQPHSNLMVNRIISPSSILRF